MRSVHPLSEIVAEVARSDDPDRAFNLILNSAVSRTQASHGCLYVLALSGGCHRAVAWVGPSEPGPDLDVLRFENNDPRTSPPLERAILTKELVLCANAEDHIGRDNAAGTGSRLVFPIIREDTCIGLIELASDTSGHFRPSDRKHTWIVDALASAVVGVYRKKQMVDFISVSQHTADFRRPYAAFLEEVMLYASVASGMRYVALREYDDGSLRCLRSLGFDEDDQVDLLDLENLREDDPFREVITTERPHIAVSLRESKYLRYRARRELRNVRSFVVLPVYVDGILFGTLSFATSVEYEYTPTEVAVFRAIANTVGAALTSQKNFHSYAASMPPTVDLSSAITGLEVSQSVRHEILEILGNHAEEVASTKLDVFPLLSGRQQKEVEARLDVLESTVARIGQSVDKIRVATGLASAERELVDLRDIWDKSVDQVRGRLGLTRVDPVWEGPGVQVVVAPDLIVQVFALLLVNSCEAFVSSKGMKRERKIRLIAERVNDRALDIEVTYVDNAGGINPAALRGSDGQFLASPGPDSVFQRGVTSKKTGSGWGLYIVRRILTDQHGSINLVDHRGGVTLKLRLPNPLNPSRRKLDAVL